nr:hypothetical protein CFP56_18512 [Quercus suber]
MTQRFNVKDAVDNYLLFGFESELDVEKVIMGEPWSYDRHLVILHRYDGKTPLADLQLSTAMFWVQIHNLPFSMLSPEIAMDIGETLGEVRRLESTSEMFGPWIRAAQFNNSRKSVVEVASFGKDSFIPSREASLLNNPRKFNQTLTGSVHRLVTISLEMGKGGGSSDQELEEVSQKEVNIGNRQLDMESIEVTKISKVGDAVSDFEQKIREIDRELTEDIGGSNLNILKSDTINLEVPLEVNCDANSEIVGDKEVVDKMSKLHAIHVSNPMNCGPM